MMRNNPMARSEMNDSRVADLPRQSNTARRWLRRLGWGAGGVMLLVCSVASVASFRSLPGEVRTPAGLRRNQCVYVALADGTRLAVDFWLPADLAAGQRVPTVFRPARYIAAGDLAFLSRVWFGLGFSQRWFDELDAFNRAGYACVSVSLRGAGASFGQRPAELSDRDVDDLVEILDWTVRQPWSDGRVGLIGVSYDGAVAELLAGRGHTAVKAAVLQFSMLDTYQAAFPGGIYWSDFLQGWALGAERLDVNDWAGSFGLRGWQTLLLRLSVRGHKPVDGPDGARLLREAISSHRTPAADEVVRGAEFRDDRLAQFPLTWEQISTYRVRAGLERAQIPLQVWVSWLDAADPAHGALCRFITHRVPQQVIIGAWNHGGFANLDPLRPTNAPREPTPGEYQRTVIEFFDSHLKSIGSNAPKHEVRYATLGESEWRTNTRWPPDGLTPQRWFFGPGQSLGPEPPTDPAAADTYRVNFAASTGRGGRSPLPLSLGRSNPAALDTNLLCYTSAPLNVNAEVTGSPTLHLEVSSSSNDGAFFVYLEDVAPDGRVAGLTEGHLRALHRKLSTSPLPYEPLGPRRSFLRADAAPLVPGEVVALDFNLASTSLVFRRGHRIRVTLAGADAGVFTRIPAEGEVRWQVQRSSVHPSWIELPMRESR